MIEQCGKCGSKDRTTIKGSGNGVRRVLVICGGCGKRLSEKIRFSKTRTANPARDVFEALTGVALPEPAKGDEP